MKSLLNWVEPFHVFMQEDSGLKTVKLLLVEGGVSCHQRYEQMPISMEDL